MINDIQRLINYSPKRDRKYRERKKENSKREDERGGRRGVRWGGGTQERQMRQMMKVVLDEDGEHDVFPVTFQKRLCAYAVMPRSLK